MHMLSPTPKNTRVRAHTHTHVCAGHTHTYTFSHTHILTHDTQCTYMCTHQTLDAYLNKACTQTHTKHTIADMSTVIMCIANCHLSVFSVNILSQC